MGQSDMTGAEAGALLEVTDLSVRLPVGPREMVSAVRGVSLVVRQGERIGIVGESGSGKSVTGRAIAGLLPLSRRVEVRGSIRFDGEEMVGASAQKWQHVRAKRVGMVFQDPMTYLNPTMRIGAQVRESIVASRDGRAARSDVSRFLELVGLPDPDEIALRYPHQLSGGMRQRVLIAIAIAKLPDIVLADEPTTALDATVQKRVLEMLDQRVAELGTSLILISHDLAVVSEMTDRLYVTYGGYVVEAGTTEQVLQSPQHRYTQALLRSVRSLTDEDVELYSIPSELRDSLDRDVAQGRIEPVVHPGSPKGRGLDGS